MPLINVIKVEDENTTQGLQRLVIVADVTGTMLYSFRRHYTFKGQI
jgi:hypothetical protein